MIATASSFALIGRSFPSESFDGLYQSSLVWRRARRGDMAAGRLRQLPSNAWLAARRLPVMPSAAR